MYISTYMHTHICMRENGCVCMHEFITVHDSGVS